MESARASRCSPSGGRNRRQPACRGPFESPVIRLIVRLTLNQQVRGSSPWRRTMCDQGHPSSKGCPWSFSGSDAKDAGRMTGHPPTAEEDG